MIFRRSGEIDPARRDPITAVCTETVASIRATFQSIVLARACAVTPEANPKTSVIRATPMATWGSRPRTRMKSGEKNVAPPIPAPLAIAAMTTAIGSKNQ